MNCILTIDNKSIPMTEITTCNTFIYVNIRTIIITKMATIEAIPRIIISPVLIVKSNCKIITYYLKYLKF